MSRTFDLNNPDDARDYLTTLEADGRFSLDGTYTAQDLTDVEAVNAAAAVFLKLNTDTSGKVQ